MPVPRFLVYTREDCTLCEEFIAELGQLVGEFEVRDVDDDPGTRRRFGLKVPALTCDGRLVCHGHLDSAAIARISRR
jgi:hypothetical protein